MRCGPPACVIVVDGAALVAIDLGEPEPERERDAIVGAIQRAG